MPSNHLDADLSASTSEDIDLDKVLKVAQDAARLAGSTILKATTAATATTTTTATTSTTTNIEKQKQIEIKSSSTDLVTVTDKQCEEIIINHIKSVYPTHTIIGEETSSNEKYTLTDDPTWTIDPIDGTTNFVHNLNMSCVLIGFLVNKQVKVGVTYLPYTNELFYAVKGSGAYLQTKDSSKIQRIFVSKHTKSLNQAIISMDPGYGRDQYQVTKFCQLQSKILNKGNVRNIRILGATGINMAYVACGKLDAAFEQGSWTTGLGPKIWDFTPGKLLIEEAGGITYDIEQQPVVQKKDAVSASTTVVNSTDTAVATVDATLSSLLPPRPLDLMQRSFFVASTVELAQELLKHIQENDKEFEDQQNEDSRNNNSKKQRIN